MPLICNEPEGSRTFECLQDKANKVQHSIFFSHLKQMTFHLQMIALHYLKDSFHIPGYNSKSIFG